MDHKSLLWPAGAGHSVTVGGEIQCTMCEWGHSIFIILHFRKKLSIGLSGLKGATTYQSPIEKKKILKIRSSTSLSIEQWTLNECDLLTPLFAHSAGAGERRRLSYSTPGLGFSSSAQFFIILKKLLERGISSQQAPVSPSAEL